MTTNTATIDVLGIVGSLRMASFNKMALTLAGDSMPSGMTLEMVEWHTVPPFNADTYAEGYPFAVAALRERIRRADALVIATPEYNFSIPGMLKNLLDWISRGDDQPLNNKPVAILSAATGPLGGARVQYDLRRVLLFVNALVLAKPEVFIGNAQAKFAPDGRCIDEKTQQFLVTQMQALQKAVQASRHMKLMVEPIAQAK